MVSTITAFLLIYTKTCQIQRDSGWEVKTDTQLHRAQGCVASSQALLFSDSSDGGRAHPHPTALRSHTALASHPEMAILDLEQFLFPLVHRTFQVSTESISYKLSSRTGIDVLGA